MRLTCFKAYDVRGRVGENLDEEAARRIGRAVAAVLAPERVVVGRDARASSPALCAAMVEGLRASGVDVIDIGLCGTEEVYFATAHLAAGAGVMVTASHNPIDYNGMKLVGAGSRPLSVGDFGALRMAAEAGDGARGGQGGYARQDTRAAYAAHVAGMVDAAALAPLKVLTDAGNGTAGAALDAIVEDLVGRGAPIDIVRLHHAPDPNFPNGIPNPLLEENRHRTSDAVRTSGADLGVAWDGDFDRCFFFDQAGKFVAGEYMVALLAEAVLADEAGATIVHDPRAVWATEDAVVRAGGRTAAAPVGHAFLKARMRETGAAYGGEMSAHHYFRDFFCCDSGMIPWLKTMELVSHTGRSLADLVEDLRVRFPSSGEINFSLADPHGAIERVVARFGPEAMEIDRLDGVSLCFAQWRMNLRASNTEPLLRLNVETRGDTALLAERVEAIRSVVDGG